ncbi:hypothetical protein IAQ61_004260 [Plenodomus lingam]|uniref:uncharacterized protein n=1 Tax=Leptosphaeria maculans TaxID=5022 RepID=UPI00331A6820|nr:hypothetical protein IAQ61_004260 [Plenodomus lingam]
MGIASRQYQPPSLPLTVTTPRHLRSLLLPLSLSLLRRAYSCAIISQKQGTAEGSIEESTTAGHPDHLPGHRNLHPDRRNRHETGSRRLAGRPEEVPKRSHLVDHRLTTTSVTTTTLVTTTAASVATTTATATASSTVGGLVDADPTAVESMTVSAIQPRETNMASKVSAFLHFDGSVGDWAAQRGGGGEEWMSRTPRCSEPA